MEVVNRSSKAIDIANRYRIILSPEASKSIDEEILKIIGEAVIDKRVPKIDDIDGTYDDYLFGGGSKEPIAIALGDAILYPGGHRREIFDREEIKDIYVGPARYIVYGRKDEILMEIPIVSEAIEAKNGIMAKKKVERYLMIPLWLREYIANRLDIHMDHGILGDMYLEKGIYRVKPGFWVEGEVTYFRKGSRITAYSNDLVEIANSKKLLEKSLHPFNRELEEALKQGKGFIEIPRQEVYIEEDYYSYSSCKDVYELFPDRRVGVKAIKVAGREEAIHAAKISIDNYKALKEMFS